jgi:glycosyltransferase involved in cell wall biosynthesis
MIALNTTVIIPAFNEEQAIGHVVNSIPMDLVREIIVVDNGSSDLTAETARNAGARVVVEPRRGYGSAYLAGIASLPERVDSVVFMDGDFSDYPEEIFLVLEPIASGKAELVIGSRVLGGREKGALTPQQQVGNWLATRVIHLVYGVQFTDLGPFRAITASALRQLNMRDRDFGWTVEMQVKALRIGLRVIEVPVSYRKRIGKSKISGTLSGAIRAAAKISWMILRITLETQAEGR